MLERELDVAREAARAAAAVLQGHFRDRAAVAVREKAEDDPVTAADLEANAAIEEILAGRFPEDAVLSEESHREPGRSGARRLWIVDPMDGTRAFVEGQPEFSVSIALVEDGRPVVGVVHQPLQDVAVWARVGGGAFRSRGAAARAEPVRVGACRRLDEATLLVSRREHARGELDAWLGRAGGVETLSSIAWKLALVACGEADLNLTTRPKHLWDVCAGDLLVHEAGGRYRGPETAAPRYESGAPEIPGPMAAGNEELLAQLFRQ